MEEKLKPTEMLSGCGCLLVLLISGAAYFLSPDLGYNVFWFLVIIFLMISSFFGAIISESQDVRYASGCFSIIGSVILGILVHVYFPNKMWIFYTFCGLYIGAVFLGICYRKARLERGKVAAQNFKEQLESEGIDLNNLDE